MNKLFHATTVFMLLSEIASFKVSAQTDSSASNNVIDTTLLLNLNEIVITASRSEQNTFSSERSMTVASNKEIKEKNQFSALDALNDKIGVWIEKRTTTSSDPVIRGLSGSHILALVDGNTLSTLWGEGGEGGDDMYGKVDGESVDRMEVIRGPASVMYGSNALGGVINFITKKSPLTFRDTAGIQIGGKIKGVLGSASQYSMGRIETWGASQKFRYFIGSTTHRSDNMRAGGNIGYINPSGGRDWSIDMNSEMRISTNKFISLGGQYMNRPETYRSYRPSQSNTNERSGLNLGYRSTDKTAFSDIFIINLYTQYKKDTRTWYTDSTRSVIDQNGFSWWQTYSADLHAVKAIGSKNHLLYGAGYHLDIAESPDDEQFTIKTSSGSQKASPETHWQNAGIYAHNDWELIPLITLSAGLRYDYFFFSTGKDVFYTKPGDTDTAMNKAITNPTRYTEHALTGSAAAIFHLSDDINIATTWSHGFRMNPPSFGFRQTAEGVLIPNGLLKPITADMFEISPRLRTKLVDINMSGYYTLFSNFQQPIYSKYNGSSFIDYNNNGINEPDERVLVNTPDGKGFITGVELDLGFYLGALSKKLNRFRFIGGAMYCYGRMQFPGQKEAPLTFTHPTRGVIKFRYEDPSLQRKAWIELSADIVAKFDQIDANRLNSDVGYLQNPQNPNSGLYRSYGLPSYQVLNARGGFIFNNYIHLTLAVENILDVRYRTAHSPMDASGRNILVGLELIVAELLKH